ncbi:hypothetical protein IFR05_012782, partial [Cadophora sp. M221]
MAISRSKLPVSLLLLTFPAAILACGSSSLNPEPVLKRDHCVVSSFSLLGAESICPSSETPDCSLYENESSARDQVLFMTDTDDPEDRSTAPTSPLYTILPIPSKGLGLI